MKHPGKRKLTKAELQAAKEQRAQLFADKTDEEIRKTKLTAKAYLYEIGKKVFVFVPKCPVCHDLHEHGAYSALNGLRSPICLITDEPIPNNYQLQIDWSDKDNVRLAQKYNI